MLSSSDALVLIGAGKMGGAMLSGWLAGGLSGAQVYLRDPNPPAEMAKLVAEQGLRLNFSVADIAAQSPRVVILAVKPQIMETVLPDLAPLVQPGTLFLSIAAGVGLSRLEEMLGGGAAIVRTLSAKGLPPRSAMNGLRRKTGLYVTRFCLPSDLSSGFPKKARWMR